MSSNEEVWLLELRFLRLINCGNELEENHTSFFLFNDYVETTLPNRISSFIFCHANASMSWINSRKRCYFFIPYRNKRFIIDSFCLELKKILISKQAVEIYGLKILDVMMIFEQKPIEISFSFRSPFFWCVCASR